VNSYAGQFWCTGTIDYTYLTKDGLLYINGSWRQQHTILCNINIEREGVTIETCKGWLSIAMAARLSQVPVVVHYADVPSCEQIPKYGAAPVPSYLMMSK
jgi:hypothetical protein